MICFPTCTIVWRMKIKRHSQMFSSVLHISHFKMQYGKAKMGASYAFERPFQEL
jgi:hypothetical protein